MTIYKTIIPFFLVDNLNSTFEILEFENLTKRFNKVVIITTSEFLIPIELQKKIDTHLISFDNYAFKKIVFKSFFYIPLFICEFFSSKYLFNFSLFRNRISMFLRSIYLSDEIYKIYDYYKSNENSIIFYSFWFNHWSTALSILKNNYPDFLTVSRTHGTDLFEERVPVIKRIAFRSFQLKYIDKVFSVSKTGADYLKNKYPNFKNKISTCYLGTTFRGKNPFNEMEIFTIVSCAKIRNIKRIHLIADILFYIDIPIRWVHFGSENKGDPTIPILNENLNRLKHHKKNIEVLFKGDVENEEIFDFYLNNSVNLFLSVSETEGLPVSMMEAISCGIPIMATDVGGCHEIVTESTGELIPENFNPELVSKKIVAFSL